MNRLIVIMLFGFGGIFSSLQAQEFSFGLKAGITKTIPNGEEITASNLGVLGYSNATYSANGEIGFHGGIWTQLSFGRFFLRPEIVYSSLEASFDFPSNPVPTNMYSIEELSVPVLVGYNVFGPLDVYGGIAYKNIISATMDQLQSNSGPIPDIVVQNTPFSAQVGVKAEFGSFGLDVRYDHSLSTAEPQNVDFIAGGPNPLDPTVNLARINDPRLNQLIVSLTLKLFDSENSGKRRRAGGNCYF